MQQTVFCPIAVTEPPITVELAAQVGAVGEPLKISPGELTPLAEVHLRWLCPTDRVTIAHEKSLPTFSVSPEQFAPVGAPHVHPLQARVSLAPVFQYDVVVEPWQTWTPSYIVQTGKDVTGAHAPPKQPPPMFRAAQKRTVFIQLTGPGVGVPAGTQFPGDTANAVVRTP